MYLTVNQASSDYGGSNPSRATEISLMYKTTVQHKFISHLIDHTEFGLSWTCECSCGWACTYHHDNTGTLTLDTWEHGSEHAKKFWQTKHIGYDYTDSADL